MNIRNMLRLSISFFVFLTVPILHAASDDIKSSDDTKSSWNNISSSSLSGLSAPLGSIKTTMKTVKINADTIALLNKRLQKVDGETSISGVQGYAGNTLVDEINSTTKIANDAYNIANGARNTANSAQNTANQALHNAASSKHLANYLCDTAVDKVTFQNGFLNTWYGHRLQNMPQNSIHYSGHGVFRFQIAPNSSQLISQTISKSANDIGFTNGYYDSYRNYTGDGNTAWQAAMRTLIYCQLDSFK